MPPDGRAPTLVPRDASTLLVLDRTLSGLRVLLGRRRADLAFNPGAYVFPGGRVDPGDGLAPAAVEPGERQIARLLDRMRRSPSRRRARGLLAAALRETAEETGYLLGRPGHPPTRDMPAGYATFGAAAVGLDLSAPVLVGRAITPVGRPRRFDARFFAVFADDAVAVAPTDPLPPDGELADVAFVPVDEAESFPLPRITRVMLRELAERIAADPRLEHDLPAPFFVPVGNTHRRETI